MFTACHIQVIHGRTHQWNDFKLVWMNKHAQPKTLEELEQLVKGAIEYFNTKRAYASRNGLTAEQFRNQAT